MNNNKNEILQMAEQGMSIKAIAVEMSISEGTVKGVLKASGQQVAKLLRDEPTIIKMYQDGSIRIQAILKEHSLSYSQLYGILGKHEVPVRSIADKDGKKAKMDVAIELYKRGTPIHMITFETGVAQPTLHAELHSRGVPLRRPRK